MKKSVLIIVVALIALGLGVVTRHLLPTLAATTSSPLPEFSFPDLSGRQHSISEWRDKILIINFWATWCPPCREEIPELIELQRQYSVKGLQIIGIAIEDQETVSEFVDFADINYPILIAGDQGIALASQLGNSIGAVPYTVVVDRQGQIIYRQPGQITKENLLNIIEPLMK